ncbi:inositol polyphosphate 5-phosphatase OCRL isoform X1 [Schistocerca nitens]|uniref:inositol polyphosphate 5-phosphatase OCRL isoform X1 n=2 Tax=Schistocerca nitens TaxID=7011 RepID=UPI002117F335|nr:inositol polyphosphate 5-phosphatase OCRL isoform X1 [Schistocerca nitens]
MDVLTVVQTKLSAEDNVVSVHEASLMQGWVRTSRVLALVENENDHALFVFLSSRVPPQSFTDLTIERTLPVDADFRCEIDPESKHQDGVDVYVNISSYKLKLLFEMVPGVKTSNFVGELFRVMEVYSKRRGPPPEFQWLRKYAADNSYSALVNVEKPVDVKEIQPATKDDSLATSLLELESPDITLPRQSIAKGTTPIAARESVIRYQMAMKERHYTYTQVLKVFIGTWNVNGQPPTVPLTEWLAHDPEPPDIYAIGFQELDLSKEAFLFNDTPREEEWLSAVMNSLHPKARYRKIALVRLVGMMLLIFVQEQHVAYVRGVATETVGTGIMGKMGNKGGVGVRLDFHSTSICFVNSHLAAHVEEYERRNQDYHDICQRMSFTRFLPPKGIKDHDQIFWLGDLNYRITDLDPKIVKDCIDKNNLETIIEFDQLRQQHKNKNVFVGYQEGSLTFRPTYKYDPGSDNWDSSEKNRAPAWCDRILWKGDGIKQLAYRSHPELKISDHKPVSALFDSQIRVIDAAKYRKIHEEVMKKLDKLENEFLPQVMVDNTEIIFDTIYYLESQTKDLIIANTGQVPVTFEFIKKLDDSSYCKDWLNIEPYAGFIMPGEKCDIRLEVFVDKKSAFKLNSGEDKLYDILVLHLEGGKDIFITVTGTYERSCFGASIEALVYITLPIREIPVGRLVELESNKEVTSTQDPYPIPKEIWFLVDHLYRHGLKQPHLFEQPGLHSEILQIRNWLDNGSPDPLPGSVHSVAEALLLLLESTAEPVIPYNLHNICLNASSNYLQCKQIVMQLPEQRKNVFLYLCTFLQEVLSHMNENGLDAKTVATLFGTIFLRDPPRSRGDLSSRVRTNQQALDRKKANFVYNFLVNDQSDLILGR